MTATDGRRLDTPQKVKAFLAELEAERAVDEALLQPATARGVVLAVRVLVARRYPSVADTHPGSVPKRESALR